MNQSQVPGSGPSYRGMLALVILLGMAIMLGVGALIGAAFMASGRPQVAGVAGEGRSADLAAGPSEAFLANLASPGQRIEGAELRDNKILVRLTGPRGDELVVVNATSGAILGRVVLVPPNP